MKICSINTGITANTEPHNMVQDLVLFLSFK